MASTLPIPNDCCGQIGCNCDSVTIASINDLIEAQLEATSADPQSYDTVVDLREANYWDHRVILLLGQLVKDDGNGGMYDFDEDNASADDGLNIVKPTDIDPAQPGRWVKRI